MLETKNDYLENLDTGYKRDVLELFSDNFRWETTYPAGQFQLQFTGVVMECAWILMSDIPAELPKHSKGAEIQVIVVNCTYLALGLQLSRIFARINCVYPGCQTHINCERNQIICDAIAIIRPGSH